MSPSIRPPAAACFRFSAPSPLQDLLAERRCRRRRARQRVTWPLISSVSVGYARLMRSLVRLSMVVIGVAALCIGAATSGGSAHAQSAHKMRIKIDSQPQQAAIYVDNKESGIKGYTPATIRLPRGTYTIILELPGFRPVSKPITVTRSEGFIFTLERQAEPAVLDVRATSSNDAATGAQLFVDGAPVGTVPARVEVPAGKHRIEVKKAGLRRLRRYRRRRRGRSAADGDRSAAGGEEGRAPRDRAISPAPTCSSTACARIRRRRSSSDIPEGQHSLEVKKDQLDWKQIVTVVGGQQQKVDGAAGAGRAGDGTCCASSARCRAPRCGSTAR